MFIKNKHTTYTPKLVARDLKNKLKINIILYNLLHVLHILYSNSARHMRMSIIIC